MRRTESVHELGILRTAAFVLTGYVLFAVFRFTIGLMLPGLTAEFRLSPAQSGAFASAPLLATVLTMSIGGYTSDRFNRKLVFSMGSLILWVGALLSSISPSYLLALAFIFVAGAGAGFLPPSIYSIMGDLRPQARASLTGTTAAVYNVGGFVGSVGLGWLIGLSGWRISLTELSVLGLIYLPIMVLFMGSVPDSRGSEAAGGRSSLSYLALAKSKNIALAGSSLFMAMYASFAVMSWAPTYLAGIGIASSLSGVVIGVFSLAGAFAAFVSGRLADAWSEKRLILTTGAVAGIVSALLFMSSLNFAIMIVLVVLLGFMVWPSWNLVTSMVQRLADPAAVGSTTGLVQTLGMTGGFLGPILTGVLVRYFALGPTLLGSVTITLWLYALLITPFRDSTRKAGVDSPFPGRQNG